METSKFLEYLKENKLTIAFAESITGGGLCSYYVAYPGASKVIKGGIVAYQRMIKESILNIEAKMIDTYGIASIEVAIVMAQRIRQQMKSDIGIGITGDAGPTLQDKSVKKAFYVAVSLKDKIIPFQDVFNNDNRSENINEAIYKTNAFLEKSIQGLI